MVIRRMVVVENCCAQTSHGWQAMNTAIKNNRFIFIPASDGVARPPLL
jgi:hypothetical protein